jgi:diguanylate cyclase (GGDEF)-like protein
MPMMLCDGDTLSILQANQAACDFLWIRTRRVGFKKGGRHARAGAGSNGSPKRFMNSTATATRTVWRQYAANGDEHHVLIYVRLLHEGAKRRLLLTVADVSEQITAEAEANRLAHHDVLTGLPNRMQFYKALTTALKSNDDKHVFVLCLGLDGFKPVNDIFGDAVLKMTSDRLHTAAGDHMIARLGGDEFAIHDRRPRSRCRLGKTLHCSRRGSLSCSRHGYQDRVSIGLAASTIGGIDGDRLVQAADRALYRANANGRNT